MRMNASSLYFFITVMLTINCSEQFSSYFKNYNEAVQSQSWKGNWIPRNLPKDAVNISESHNLDINAVILKYETNRNMKNALDSSCSTIQNVNELDFAVIREKWWPTPLFGNAKLSSNEYWYYQCENGFYAVQFSEKTTVYYWKN